MSCISLAMMYSDHVKAIDPLNKGCLKIEEKAVSDFREYVEKSDLVLHQDYSLFCCQSYQENEQIVEHFKSIIRMFRGFSFEQVSKMEQAIENKDISDLKLIIRRGPLFEPYQEWIKFSCSFESVATKKINDIGKAYFEELLHSSQKA
jgi:hypothetical protein